MEDFPYKISKKTRANFAFYEEVFDKMGEGSGIYKWTPLAPRTLTALQAFYMEEHVGCKKNERYCSHEPIMICKVRSGKGIINLHIKMWSEGIADGLFQIEEFYEGHEWFRDWVWKAIRGQVERIRERKYQPSGVETLVPVPEREFTQLDWVLQATGPSWRWDIVRVLPLKPRDEDLFLVEVE